MLQLVNAAVSPTGATWEQQQAIHWFCRGARRIVGQGANQFRKLNRKVYPRWEENDAGTSNYTPCSDGQWFTRYSAAARRRQQPRRLLRS